MRQARQDVPQHPDAVVQGRIGGGEAVEQTQRICGEDRERPPVFDAAELQQARDVPMIERRERTAVLQEAEPLHLRRLDVGTDEIDMQAQQAMAVEIAVPHQPVFARARVGQAAFGDKRPDLLHIQTASRSRRPASAPSAGRFARSGERQRSRNRRSPPDAAGGRSNGPGGRPASIAQPTAPKP